MSRPSFDRSAILTRSSDKRLDETLRQEPKRHTPSEPAYSSDEEDDDAFCYATSGLDTCATASVFEGNTAIRLPVSQI